MGERTRSVLINARDLGRGWKTTQRSYDRDRTVERPSIDPGIEEDGASCSVMVFMGSPDGVKTEFASHLLILEIDDSRIYLTTAAAVFPAEKNARARAAAYANAIRGCADEMRSVMAGWAMPPKYARRVRVTSRRLALPGAAFGLRTLTRHGGNIQSSDYRDVLIQRGRMVAGFSIHGRGYSSDDVDVVRLTELVAERLERAAKTLRPSRVRIPVYTPDPVAESVARAALMRTSDHPGEWRDHAFAEYGPDSGTSVYPGSLLIQLDDLRPEPGMLGRAVAASHHVGWSHYMRHHAAVYRTERQARAAARSAIERSQPPANQRRSRRRGSVRATNLDAPALDRDVYAKFRVKTWRMPAGKNHTAMDVTSTDTLAVIRRGRMVATYACAAKGEDVETAHKLLKMVIRKLERADCRLTD